MQKRALFETFIDRIVAYKDGKIVINVDVFGIKAKIESIDGVVNGVRTEKLVLRHHCYQDTYEKVRVFFLSFKAFFALFD